MNTLKTTIQGPTKAFAVHHLDDVHNIVKGLINQAVLEIHDIFVL